MDFETTIALFGALVCLDVKKTRKRRIWCKRWLNNRREFSHMKLLKELVVNEPQDFKNYMRMTNEAFEELLNLVGDQIEKQSTVMRESISPRERLVATLQFLASGRKYENLKFSCAISPQSLGRLIPETCKAIFNALQEKYVPFPSNKSDWMNIAEDFKKYWNVENCLGAIDGKHIAIKQPPNSGSYFYNYKGFFSVVLFAIVNANYEFIYVHSGTNGRVSDGGVLMETDFGEMLEDEQLQKIPSPTSYTKDRDVCLPFVFIGDEAFPLKENLMKPYSNRGISLEEKVFNYRICRGRRIVENAFGILANRFQILQTTIGVNLKATDQIVLACCALHNFLRKKIPLT